MVITKEQKAKVAVIVGEYFLRVCKNHNFYIQFRRFFTKHYGKKTSLNPYMERMSHFALMATQEMEKMHSKSIYDYITHVVNLTLRHYLEKQGVTKPQELCSIGQELFDLSCYALFGNAYITDMEKENAANGIPTPRNEREAFIIGEWQMRRAQGENISIEDLFQHYSHLSDEQFFACLNNPHGLRQCIEDLNEDIDEDFEEDIDDDFMNEEDVNYDLMWNETD